MFSVEKSTEIVVVHFLCTHLHDFGIKLADNLVLALAVFIEPVVETALESAIILIL